jgi:hypothetical protein
MPTASSPASVAPAPAIATSKVVKVQAGEPTWSALPWLLQLLFMVILWTFVNSLKRI